MSRPRPSLVILLLLTMLAWATADVSGPVPPGQPANRAPVLVAGKVQPSPQTSPGVVQNIAVDSNGSVLVNGTVAAPSGSPLVVQGPAAQYVASVGSPVLVGGSTHATGGLPAATVGDAYSARLLVDRYGRPRVSLEAGDGSSLANSNGNYVQGPAAHDLPVSGNPVRIGGYSIAIPDDVTQVSNGDTCNYLTTPHGQQRVVADCNQYAGGATAFRTVTLTNVSQEVKPSFGNVYSIILGNPNSGNSWVHVYNTANSSVAVGTTTPAATYMVAANATLIVPGPVTHSTAITIACTNAATGTQAPANNITATVHYK